MRIPPDSFQTQGLRKKLIQSLRAKGIDSEKVLGAMMQVPRHFFYFDDIFIEKAYQNIAFQIGAGQTISAPFTVALQTSLLEVQPGDKILEIGTGSGYQTAILCKLGAEVYSIERQKYLFEKTQKLLHALGIRAHLHYGDGFEGLPAFAPFDKILVTCAAAQTPDTLLEQLKVGGKIVLPFATSADTQDMFLLQRKSFQRFIYKNIGDCKFVPMLAETDRDSF